MKLATGMYVNCEGQVEYELNLCGLGQKMEF